jgi:DNA-binding Lrp family transcriptional regulator
MTETTTTTQPTAADVLAVIAANSHATTTKELADKLGVPAAEVRKIADALAKDGKVERITASGRVVYSAVAESTGKPKAELVTECTACGFQFPKPQARKTCRVQAACDKRQAKRAETAAAAAK